MDNYYIFKHRKVAKRSIEPSQNYEQLLVREPQVCISVFQVPQFCNFWYSFPVWFVAT